jgi:hypothetical protein
MLCAFIAQESMSTSAAAEVYSVTPLTANAALTSALFFVRLGRTYAVQSDMSALPPKADMCSALTQVCFGPIADMEPHKCEAADLCSRRPAA